MTQATREPVRLGVIGAGNFGRLHAVTAHALGEARLAAVVDPRPECLAKIRELMPEVPTWSRLDGALDESQAEAWVVASTTATHVSAARQVLERGRPVLVEKPLSESLAEAASLAPLVQGDSSNLMMGHILLFNTELRQLMDEVRQRGPIAYLNSVRHRPTATIDLFPGESPLHLLMVHDLYATLALVGRAEPTHFHAKLRRNERGVCDLAAAVLGWPDGTLATYTASFLTPAGMSSDGFDRLEVFGRGWAARIEPNPRPIEVWDDRAHWPMALEIRADRTAPSGMLAEELRCFCRVVRGVEAVPVGATYADAMQVQRWLEELEKSAANT
jgi:predicted dehydrogenase